METECNCGDPDCQETVNTNPFDAVVVAEYNQDNYDAWQEQRKMLVGASDIPTILGLSKYSTALEVWAQRTGKIPPFRGNRATRYGKKVERAILDLFAEDHANDLTLRVNNDSYISKAFPFASATPDAFVIEGEELGMAEAKHYTYAVDEWEDNSLPSSVHMQVVWQMGVMQLKYCYVPAILAGKANNVIEPRVDWDNDARDAFEVALSKAEKFIECVKSDIPPGAGAGDRKLVARLVENNLVAPPPVLDASYIKTLDEMLEAQKEKSVHEKASRELSIIIDKSKSVLQLASGGKDYILLPDGRRVNFSKVVVKERHQAGYSYWNVKAGK